jgi:DNA-binding beta-propeller fold protein YncE
MEFTSGDTASGAGKMLACAVERGILMASGDSFHECASRPNAEEARQSSCWRTKMSAESHTQNLPSRSGRKTSLYLALFSAMLLVAALPVLSADVNLNSPTGTHGLIMVDKVGGYVRFFDPATDKELAGFDASDAPGTKPHELAISPDHKTAYVSVYGSGVYGNNPHPGHTIDIFDLASQKLVGTIDVSPYRAPHGLQIDRNGMLYAACDLDRKVLILDTKKRTIEAATDVEGTGHWIALLPDGSKLYVANKDDKPFISVIDLKSRKMVGRVSMPGGTEGIVASPDGKTVLAADHSTPYLHVISSAMDTEVDKVQLKGFDQGLYKVFYTPDGKRVLTCLGNGQINIFNAADLHAPQKVMRSAGTALMGFAFSADGKTALVGNHGEGTISRIDLETATVVKTFPAGKGVETLAYY